MQKNYFALAQGRWPAKVKQVDAPLRKSVLRSGERMVTVQADGKAALSRFKRVAEVEAATLLDVNIRTGRTHQIRVHAAHVGCPLAGDERYGDTQFNAIMSKHGLRRLFLHARRVHLDDLTVVAPLPEDLSACLRQLGINPSAVEAALAGS